MNIQYKRLSLVLFERDYPFEFLIKTKEHDDFVFLLSLSRQDAVYYPHPLERYSFELMIFFTDRLSFSFACSLLPKFRIYSLNKDGFHVSFLFFTVQFDNSYI